MNNSVKKIEWPLALEDNREYICCIACFYPITLLPEAIKLERNVVLGFTVEVQNLFTNDFDVSNAVEYWQKKVKCYNCSFNLSDPFDCNSTELKVRADLLQKVSFGLRKCDRFFFLHAKKLLQFEAIEMKKRFDRNENFKESLKYMMNRTKLVEEREKNKVGRI